MKKILFIIFLLFFIKCDLSSSNITIQLRGAYFFPSEKAFKDIYGSGIAYGGELNIEIIKILNLWISGNYFSKKGKLSFTNEDTKVTIIPIGVGVTYNIMNKNIIPYFGLGLNYYQYREESLMLGDAKKGGLGYIGKIGLLFKTSRRFFVDIFLRYSYCKMKPKEFKINIGGFEGGIGLGYKL